MAQTPIQIERGNNRSPEYIQTGKTTLSLPSATTSKYVDIYSYQPATSYDVNLTISSTSPQFSYKPGYAVFSAGSWQWGIRALFDTTGPFGTDSNGRQIYALLRIFVEQVSGGTISGSTATFNISYLFTNQKIV